MHKYTEYKVECISEGALGTLLLGASKIPVKKLEARLNELVKDGWQVVFKVVEQKRMLLFWTRETVLVTLGR